MEIFFFLNEVTRFTFFGFTPVHHKEFILLYVIVSINPTLKKRSFFKLVLHLSSFSDSTGV
jgi:hypothetical protein